VQRVAVLATPVSLCLSLALTGCHGSTQQGRLRTDPPGTAFNVSTSRWSSLSSTGAYGFIKQQATGVNTFDFEETWIHGKGPKWVATIGKGTYEPSTGLNIYEYSKPRGVVVVRTEEGRDEQSTRDTVLATTLALFKPGETITYYKR
jgi:hypothetical protein